MVKSIFFHFHACLCTLQQRVVYFPVFTELGWDDVSPEAGDSYYINIINVSALTGIG